MHILHALFTSGKGGLEASYIDITEALRAKGHSVSALLRGDAAYRVDVEQVASVVYIAAPTGFYDFISAWKIRCLLKRLRPDLVLAHNARAIALLSLAVRGTGIPVCGVSHSYKTARTVRAQNLVVLTSHMREHFLNAGYPVAKLHVIPNMVHLPDRLVMRPHKTPMVIGAIGRFTVEKGFSDFFKALSILKQNGVQFNVRLAGEGEESGELHLLAEKLGLSPQITWEGWVKDKAEFYRKLDIVCVPSLEESFGLVVLEALAHGVAVVATDAPGPASLLTHGVNGLLVKRGDAGALAQALQELVENPELAVKLAQAGWQRAQDFGFESAATRWDQVLTAISRK